MMRLLRTPIRQAYREARLKRLVSQQGYANALNLLAAAHAEAPATSNPRFLGVVLSFVREHQPGALAHWEKMNAPEREAVTSVAVAFLGRQGARGWLVRQGEIARGLMEELDREVRAGPADH